MRALVALWLLYAGGPEPKRMFEEKCLYCHSAHVIEQRRFRPAQWRQVVGKMQARAPLLISRRDADVIVRYIVRELKLVPPRTSPPLPATALKAPPVEIVTEPEEAIEELPEPPPAPPPPGPPVATHAPTPPPEEDTEAETLGPQLLAERCSKCHTLFRVFTKLDSAAVGEATIERMRRKTGSGISARDALILKRFLRSRANSPY